MDNKSTIETDADVKNGTKRLIFALVAMALQVAAVLYINLFFVEKVQIFSIVTHLAGAIMVLFIYNEQKPSAIKMTWILIIMLLPIFSIAFYFLVGMNGHTLKMSRRFKEVDDQLFPLLDSGDEPIERLGEVDLRAANIARYLFRASCRSQEDIKPRSRSSSAR